MVKFDIGPDAYVEWDDVYLGWGLFWCDRDDPESEYERDAWGFEGRIDGVGR